MQVSGKLDVRTALPPKKVQGTHRVVLREPNGPSGCFYLGKILVLLPEKERFLNVEKPIE
jgi:hypothetical protein